MTGTDLVTGGAGFIGSELVGQLVTAGRRVVVLDDLTTGRRENLHQLAHDRVDLVAGDVRDVKLAAASMPDVDTVYHLACVNLRRSLHDPEAAHAVNATGTLALLEVARRARVLVALAGRTVIQPGLHGAPLAGGAGAGRGR